VLVAEGDKNAAILRAEGNKQSQILVADGYSQALALIFSAAKNIDSKTMALQYLDMLKALGASPSTKYIFPMEFTSLVSRLKGFVQEPPKTRPRNSLGSNRLRLMLSAGAADERSLTHAMQVS